MFFFFQAEDGIRDLVRSRGLGDVYKRQGQTDVYLIAHHGGADGADPSMFEAIKPLVAVFNNCLLYTSDAADERSSVDLGGRRIIKKKKSKSESMTREHQSQKH